MFTTVVNPEEFKYDGKSFVIFLGCRVDAKIPMCKRTGFKYVTDKALIAIKAIDIAKFSDGITVVIDPVVYEECSGSIFEVQKYLAWAYCKFIVFPRYSHTIPDLFNVRAKCDVSNSQSFDVLVHREIAKAQNTHLYVQHPLCNVLSNIEGTPPLTLVMPGPSLKTMLDERRLAFTATRTLIACFPRTLRSCLDAGVIPDFVINLDTDFRMEMLLNPGEKLPHTWLVSLSLCNIGRIASKYRGVFFMDSFDTGIFDNKYRLRESWLSCSVAGFGLAEALNVKEVYLVGADHAWYGDIGQENPYAGNLKIGEQPKSTQEFNTVPLIHQDHQSETTYDSFDLPDRKGHQATTYFNYFATSVELEYVAKEMEGTNFYMLTDEGILSSAVFKSFDFQRFNSMPFIDRVAFCEKIQKAHSNKPTIDIDGLLDKNLELYFNVRRQCLFLEMLLMDGQIKKFFDNPLVKSIENSILQRKLPFLGDQQHAASNIVRLIEKWHSTIAEGVAFLRYYKVSKEDEEFVRGLSHKEQTGDVQRPLLICSYSEIKDSKIFLLRRVLGLNAYDIYLTSSFMPELKRVHCSALVEEVDISNFLDSEDPPRIFTANFQKSIILTRMAMKEYPLVLSLCDPARTIVFEDLIKKMYLPRSA